MDDHYRIVDTTVRESIGGINLAGSHLIDLIQDKRTYLQIKELFMMCMVTGEPRWFNLYLPLVASDIVGLSIRDTSSRLILHTVEKSATATQEDLESFLKLAAMNVSAMQRAEAKNVG